MDTGALIKRARYRAGLSQRELADRAGVSRFAVSHYELGYRTPSVATLSKLLAAAGCQLRVEIEPLDADVRAAIARVAAEPLADRDAVSRWVWLTDLSCCAYRVEGLPAANMLGAPVPVDHYDLAMADTEATFEALATLVVEHAYSIRARRDGGQLHVPAGDQGRRLRELLRTECAHEPFWLRSGFAEVRVRLASSAEVDRYVEVATPHGPARVALLPEIDGVDEQSRRVLRVMRELATRE